MGKMYISKYALTDGVREVNAEICSSNTKYAQVGNNYSLYLIGRDIHLTLDVALKTAEAMRVKKIASVKKQLARLEKLTFAEGK